jgi:hypothetical protein
VAQVDFSRNEADLKAAVLASLGFSSDYISQVTGLSKGQVGYRLRLAQVKRADYRNGRTPLVDLTLRIIMPKARAIVSSEIPSEFRTAARKKAKK